MGEARGDAQGPGLSARSCVLAINSCPPLGKGPAQPGVQLPYPNSCPRRLPQRQLGDMASQTGTGTHKPPLAETEKQGWSLMGQVPGCQGAPEAIGHYTLGPLWGHEQKPRTTLVIGAQEEVLLTRPLLIMSEKPKKRLVRPGAENTPGNQLLCARCLGS